MHKQAVCPVVLRTSHTHASASVMATRAHQPHDIAGRQLQMHLQRNLAARHYVAIRRAFGIGAGIYDDSMVQTMTNMGTFESGGKLEKLYGALMDTDASDAAERVLAYFWIRFPDEHVFAPAWTENCPPEKSQAMRGPTYTCSPEPPPSGAQSKRARGPEDGVDKPPEGLHEFRIPELTDDDKKAPNPPLDDDDACTFCMEFPGDMIYLPCMHAGYCKSCIVADANRNVGMGRSMSDIPCPKCSTPITEVKKYFK